jgi:hypothetical protein
MWRRVNIVERKCVKSTTCSEHQLPTSGVPSGNVKVKAPNRRLHARGGVVESSLDRSLRERFLGVASYPVGGYGPNSEVGSVVLPPPTNNDFVGVQNTDCPPLT